MCDYVNKKELEIPRDTFNNWINSVQKYIKKNYKITFSYSPIGSVSRNMVNRKCNENFFDLDFQIVMQSIPNNYNWNRDCKKIKDIFRTKFDKFKPEGFSFCEDSTQALTTKNINKGYGFDIIITKYDEDGNFYILYNKKNTNNANNEDYEWARREEMNKYRKRLSLIKGPEMWDYLRKVYKKKRHDHKDDVEPNKKKSYQLLNESIVETLKHFRIRFQ